MNHDELASSLVDKYSISISDAKDLVEKTKNIPICKFASKCESGGSIMKISSKQLSTLKSISERSKSEKVYSAWYHHKVVWALYYKGLINYERGEVSVTDKGQSILNKQKP